MANGIPKTTLEQWRILDAVIAYGGFSQAAEKLHRSQSAISYGISRLQAQLGIPLLETRGRRAVLTEAGKALLTEARPLVADLLKLEARAGFLQKGWESEIRLAVDSVFPRSRLFKALKTFRNACPQTRIVLHEEVLSGADEALLSGEADLVIGSLIPTGYTGTPLYTVRFFPVAHPEHPLHQLQRPLYFKDLAEHTHIVIQDSGRTLPRSAGWQGARQRWSVSSLEASVAAICHGMGFAWLPEHAIDQGLKEHTLRILPLARDSVRSSILYLIQADNETVGPGIQHLTQALQEVCATETFP